MKQLCLFFISLLFFTCIPQEQKQDFLFEEVLSGESGIEFINRIDQSENFNIFSYRNFYNGGGVSIGDINNDNLPDVYFTSNMGKNKLFLNLGNFKFKDISVSAGIEGTRAWSTGVVMVDINHDGFLDIYVCNAGYIKGDDQINELFINNGDLTFTEKAADYNLNESGYTTHAAFFDYDLDGDLDCYILNNSFMPVNTLNYSNNRDLMAKDWPVRDFLKGGGDKLLRNDNDVFTDVTAAAGIYSSLIGFGLGITVGDVNNDDLPDLYVSNDFYERDYLYINQGDGTFKEDIKNWMNHLSLASMGADMADINNDGYPEIFVTEMLPETDKRRKTTSEFEDYNVHYLKLKKDFYYQYMHNTLQLNNTDRTFSEISWYSGTAASDWSWGALMFDADNDGFRDIYVCNGVYRDVTDQDFIDFFANEVIQKMVMTGKKEELESVVEKMPSNPQKNKFFLNNGDLTFKDAGDNSGFTKPSFSNGSAYGDLDNDGDLDLVVNNLMEEAFVYRNQSDKLKSNNYLKISLKGSDKNTFAIGSKVMVYTVHGNNNFQLIPTRGFQSSVDYSMVFGLGESSKVDSVVVVWPDHKRTVLNNPEINKQINISYSETETSPKPFPKKDVPKLFVESESPFITHQEDEFVDFFQEGLVIRMVSREGPKFAVGDVNGDDKEDVFIGGSTGFPGQLYLQLNGKFSKPNTVNFQSEAGFEDTATCFFDADGDGDLDLFVGSGGNNQPLASRLIQDRIYINDGSGNFKLNIRALPNNGFNTSCVLVLDYDKDGDSDLFVGSFSIPNNYGSTPASFLYQNDGMGKFSDATQTDAENLKDAGMITDAKLVNLLGDSEPELVLTGEWMAPKVYTIKNGKISLTPTGLDAYSGWWYTVEADDVDGDGDQDLILGNRGENFYFSASPEAPAKLWVSDFDDNYSTEKIITRFYNGKDMPVAMKGELTGSLVSLKKKNLKHTDYAEKSIQELFSKEQMDKALVRKANYFKSAVAINEGEGKFTLNPLPAEVQFSCVCDIYCKDLNGDGRNDLVLGGNYSGFLPQFSKLDASFGHVLLNNQQGSYTRLSNKDSGFLVRGDLKQIAEIKMNGSTFILATVNQDKPKLFRIQ